MWKLGEMHVTGVNYLNAIYINNSYWLSDSSYDLNCMYLNPVFSFFPGGCPQEVMQSGGMVEPCVRELMAEVFGEGAPACWYWHEPTASVPVPFFCLHGL